MWRLVLLSVLILVSPASLAADRPFPQTAQRGEMTPAPHPAILINGKVQRLAPGARIWNDNNLIEMPASLRGSNLPVNYTVDPQGEIDRVWILTTEEASIPITKQLNILSR